MNILRKRFLQNTTEIAHELSSKFAVLTDYECLSLAIQIQKGIDTTDGFNDLINTIHSGLCVDNDQPEEPNALEYISYHLKNINQSIQQ